MQLAEYCKEDVRGLAKLIKEREVSPEEVLACALQRMYEVNPQLNAIITDCSDWARQQLKKMRGDEPFYGVPVLVKDLGFSMQGVRYTAGSTFLTTSVSASNSDFIDRLLALGMLPFAKTNVPEFGLSYVTESILLGPCRNPYDLSRTSGGSSGGSAAAVAAGVAPVATASDGGGSIRIPAACCGLFGFKPTPGLMPVGPWVGEAWSGLSTNFVLTRSVDDSALLFELLATNVLPEPKTNVVHPQHDEQRFQPLKIACLEGAFAVVPIDKPCLDAFEQAITILTRTGHQVSSYKLSLDLEGIAASALCLIAANTCAEIENQQQLLGRKVQKKELEPFTWELMGQGKKLSASQLITAKNKLYQLLRPLHALFNQVDFVLTPALAQWPLPIGSLPTNDDFSHYLQKNLAFTPFTALFNQAGLPAMTIPVMRHNHFPLSVQFAAAKGRDRFLLHFAQQLKTLLPDFTSPVMTLGKIK
ncbi:amidase [Legionella donaldsonii]|uniref:amidase n=1 Tax=Legionella donaldsonii TaxID=45060 RepID=UPI00399D4BD6